MRQRILALVTLLAALTIVVLFRRDRPRDLEPTAAPSPEELDAAEPVVELTYAEPARAGRAEAPVAEPSIESKARKEPKGSPARRGEPDPPPDVTTETVLVFRALDGTGLAVSGELDVTTRNYSQRSGGGSSKSLSSDAEGRFEVRVERSVPGERRELEVGSEGRSARVDITGPFPPGRTDMGDLVLSPEPLIAEGTVIDESGQPVAGASVVVEAWKQVRAYSASDFEPGLFVDEETGEDGTFAVYGPTSATHMRVSIDDQRLRASPLELPVGTRGIEIVAKRSGGIAGQLLVDPGVKANALELRLRLESESRTSKGKGIADDGHFQLDGLLPGTYAFSVMAVGHMLVEIPGIEVMPGEVTQDPRLAALDLRGRLNVFTLALVPPSPSLAISGSVSFTGSGASSPVRCLLFDESPVVLLTPLATIDVTVCARDCRIERFSAIAERTEVRLRPCLAVRLALPRGILLPAPPLHVGARLEREGERPEERIRSFQTLSPTEPFDENGVAVCQALEPGRHIVRWFVERRDDSSSGFDPLDMTFEQVVVVLDRPDEQRFELALTNAALTAALAAR